LNHDFVLDLTLNIVVLNLDKLSETIGHSLPLIIIDLLFHFTLENETVNTLELLARTIDVIRSSGVPVMNIVDKLIELEAFFVHFSLVVILLDVTAGHDVLVNLSN